VNSTERRNVKCHEHLKALGKNIKWFTLHYTTNELATSGRKKRQRARGREEEAEESSALFRDVSTAERELPRLNGILRERNLC
jgi:hypothetical protein